MSGEPSKQALQRFQAGWRQFLRRIGMFKEQRPGPWCKYKASDPNRLWSPSVSNRTQTPRIPIPSHRTKIEGRRSMRKRNTHTHTHTPTHHAKSFAQGTGRDFACRSCWGRSSGCIRPETGSRRSMGRRVEATRRTTHRTFHSFGVFQWPLRG